MAETTRVVSAFIAPNNATWQGLPVNVREDGSWWVFHNGEWVEHMPAIMPAPRVIAPTEGDQ